MKPALCADRNLRAVLALLGVAAIVTVSCSASQPQPPTPTAATSGLQSPADSLAHAVPDLEALLPAEIAGVPLDRFSFAAGETGSGEEFLSTGLATIGRSASELEVAIAVPAESDRSLAIVAYRLPGMTSAQLSDLIGPDDVAGAIEAATVGGKDVLVLTEAAGTSYALAGRDALFIVSGDQDLAEAALASLP